MLQRIQNLSKNAGHIFIAIGGIGILGLIMLVVFWPDMPDSRDPAEAFQKLIMQQSPVGPMRHGPQLVSALKDHPNLQAQIINYLTTEEGSDARTKALWALNIGLQRAGLPGDIFDTIRALRGNETFMAGLRPIIREMMRQAEKETKETPVFRYDPIHTLEAQDVSEYTWKHESRLKWHEDGTAKGIPTIFVKGRSKSGRDVLFTIQRLSSYDEVITIACPIPNATPPKELVAYFTKDHCLLSMGDVPLKQCCWVRPVSGLKVRADVLKGKGYILTIRSKDVGLMLSRLTGAQTLWITGPINAPNRFADIFTFRVAGFANYYDVVFDRYD